MLKLTLPFRYATLEDAIAMAELVNMAGEGLPYYLWSQMAEPGQNPWQLGAERAKREQGAFSYKNTIVYEQQSKVVASMVGYPLSDEPQVSNYSDMPPMFVPLQQLEDRCPGTWYLNVLATYPEYRGQGIGSKLIEIAEQLAKINDKQGISIIVADSNVAARRLYAANGFTEVEQRPMVKEAWQNSGQNWVLLVKRFQKL